jgi:osmotically-inducible protein OsmY
MKRNLQSLVLSGAVLATALTALPGCAPLLVGGAVMTGIVATDRRTTGAQVEDEGIELKVASAVRQELGDRVHLNVTSFNRKVLLSGEARTQADKERAEKLAFAQENVRFVNNELEVGPSSGITQRSKDTYITGRVKAAFVDAKDLQANAVKVVTERGIVYLMGRVTSREGKRATDIVRNLSGVGVVRVIRLFDEISEEELKRLSQPPLAK